MERISGGIFCHLAHIQLTPMRRVVWAELTIDSVFNSISDKIEKAK